MTTETLINHQFLGDKHVIKLVGDGLNRQTNYQTLKSILEKCDDSIPIHIDLSQIEFIGSALIGILIKFRDKQVFLTDPNVTVLEIIKLTKIDNMFKILMTKPPC